MYQTFAGERRAGRWCQSCELAHFVHSLHLDSFTMLAPSLSTKNPFYSPQARRLHLPKLVESFSHMNCHLTELSFAPMLVSSTIKFGTMDSLLSVSSSLGRVFPSCFTSR